MQQSLRPTTTTPPFTTEGWHNLLELMSSLLLIKEGYSPTSYTCHCNLKKLHHHISFDYGRPHSHKLQRLAQSIGAHVLITSDQGRLQLHQWHMSSQSKKIPCPHGRPQSHKLQRLTQSIGAHVLITSDQGRLQLHQLHMSLQSEKISSPH